MGTSRRRPDDLASDASFRFVNCDLRQPESLPAAIKELTGGQQHIDLVVLNAGVLGEFGDLCDAEIDDLQNTMLVNVWANKAVLDWLFAGGMAVEQVVAISSGAAVNGNRGWSGYAISKAALNMFVKLYAKEQPATHFCALAPGLVDTEIQERLRALPLDERFESVAAIAAKHNTPDMPTPEAAAPKLAAAMERLSSLVESGEFVDVRKMPGV